MIDVPVHTVMTDAAPTVPPTTTTVEAAQHLRAATVSVLVVCNGDDTVLGVVTEADIVAAVAEGGVDWSVGSFVRTPIETTHPSTPVGLAADQMRDAGLSALPVVDEDDAYVGLITREVLVPYLSRGRLTIDRETVPLSRKLADTSDTATPGPS